MAGIYSASVELQSGMTFLGATGSGHTLLLDSSIEHGGEGLAPTPMELVLLALAGCTGMDVIAMLRKMRQTVTGYEVRVTGDERATDHPRVYTAITVEHIVHGPALDDAAVARAVNLSSTRYCPVSAMLGETARVTHSHRTEHDSSAR
ncbi:MAG: OsmC family protein [Chloroflexi bacterium]|nr:OsmC family protein [Chloroflexota bacterium]